MGDGSPEKKSGCGLLSAVFGRRSFWLRKSTSTGSLSNGKEFHKTPNDPCRRRSGSDGAAFLNNSGISDRSQKPISNVPNHPKLPPAQVQYKKLASETTKASSNHGQVKQNQVQGGGQVRKIPKEAIGISGELESMLAERQKFKGNGSNLVRASSSNFMLCGNLGNLGQPGGGNTNSYDVLDNLAKTKEKNINPNRVMGSVMKNEEKPSADQSGSLCRALSTRMDPEQLKIMGNEDYKNGNFAEALAFYDAAIALDPNKASYRSNKSAALTALGKLLEAVFECREAIRIEPRYQRSHQRLANLYLRLGDAEKAIYHYRQAGPEADPDDISKAKGLQVRLSKCTEARKQRDWNTLVKEAGAAISAGADSAPQINALQAEALIKLRKHQEAEAALRKSPHFDVDACTRYFGPIGSANLLMVRAQVDLAIGRFDDALAAAQRATKLDRNNKEANAVLRRIRGVSTARSNGNNLFKAGRYSEACVAYGEGLEHDPYNSVLLCNRAACRSKLNQYEKAIEDCNSAFNLRPDYAKALLRRADCYAKLGKWEASVQDYEILQKEAPEDEDVRRGLMDAKAHLTS
ncbi:hypothetical protein K2173_005207 [Erythroxylum novogranatense]|uniref:Inactive TPR repeat-containing thioredoxin TTL3-like n=1 Tax=Erythroxylum novogranatense TaxID=1862640 RepID=A0AAV8TUL2_9ROSI|nr:hypothetical protein K2173_005207 [Erythroxylum novogranatense]